QGGGVQDEGYAPRGVHREAIEAVVVDLHLPVTAHHVADEGDGAGAAHRMTCGVELVRVDLRGGTRPRHGLLDADDGGGRYARTQGDVVEADGLGPCAGRGSTAQHGDALHAAVHGHAAIGARHRVVTYGGGDHIMQQNAVHVPGGGGTGAQWNGVGERGGGTEIGDHVADARGAARASAHHHARGHVTGGAAAHHHDALVHIADGVG